MGSNYLFKLSVKYKLKSVFSTSETLLSIFNYGSYLASMNFSYVMLKAKVTNM